MHHEIITATELARNVAMSIDRVRMSGYSLYITKGSQIIAELCPPAKTGFPIEKLADLLNALPKLGEDVGNFTKDINNVRQRAVLPGNPWD